MNSAETLRILHVMRAPVGGLFRHVVDLAREQSVRGHAVGVITDSSTGGEAAETTLAELDSVLHLGLSRVPMSRHVGPQDRKALRHVMDRSRQSKADILHGHGAKGGAYVRLAGGPALKVYTPHGGSLHFSPFSPTGAAYLAIERWLKRRSDLILFESEYGRSVFRQKIGEPPLARVVHNGVSPAELEPVTPDEDAADFIYVGELRRLKGADVLIEALALLAREGWNGEAFLYGEGPDRAAFEARVVQLGLLHQVHFPGAMPARTAFRTGRILVVPSRAESLPYIVLEAAGACMPMAATRVGGIPEIFGPDADALVPSEDPAALAAALKRLRNEGTSGLTQRLHDHIAQNFTVEGMTNAVLAAYADARQNKTVVFR